MVKHGFRVESGTLVKYSHGRKRKNWKTTYRQRSRKYLEDKCEKCDSTERLTIHHVVPLSKKILVKKKNCRTLCLSCHREIEQNRNTKK